MRRRERAARPDPRRAFLVMAACLLLAPSPSALAAPPRERMLSAAERAYADGRFAEAADLFRQACATVPEDRYNFVCYVDSLWLAGRDTEAERETRSFAAAHPGEAEAFFLQGVLAARRGDLPRAERALREALARSPRSARMRVELAVLLVRSGRAAAGLAEAAAVAGDPDAASDARYVAGLAYRMAGEEAAALPWFEAALALRPLDLFAATEVYASRRALGEAPAAALFFRGNPRFPMRRILDALFDGLLEGRDRAAHAEALCALEDAEPAARAARAILLAASGNPTAARATAEPLLRDHPHLRFARLAAGLAALRDEPARAERLLASAFEPGADLFHPHLFLRLLEAFPEAPQIARRAARARVPRGPVPVPPFPLLPAARK